MVDSKPGIPYSDSDAYLGWQDFDLARVTAKGRKQCPVKNCAAKLVEVSKKNVLACPVHGIELRSNTFIYWNGLGHELRARLRNFRVRQDLAAVCALGSKRKAEKHRLGYERSEDALTWNVFVGLLEAGALREATEWLTGRKVVGQPSLYLWGGLIDLAGSPPAIFSPLEEVGGVLEEGIRKFRTEPDVILHVPGELLVCVEAKFSSGNTLAHQSSLKPGEKPTSVPDLVKRYLDPASKNTRNAIDRGAIGERLHSQLFRNVIFASEMARGEEWAVVNLVSSRQWEIGRKRSHDKKVSYVNPEDEVRAYLRPEFRQRFTFRSWEDLYRNYILGDRRLGFVAEYMRSKSASYRPAFDLEN